MTLSEKVDFLCRNIHSICSKEELYNKLEISEKTEIPLNIKLGIDPTSPDIHLGFTVLLRKALEFQNFGHNVILIIGDFTATIGDPTGKSSARPLLSGDTIQSNVTTYLDQIFKILDADKTQIRFNSSWLEDLSLPIILQLASKIRMSNLLSREDFKNRMQSSQPLFLNEVLYPIIQGYDSLNIHADVELGGSDQTFNVLMGRTLQEEHNKPKQVGLFMPLLVGVDGTRKMSKSFGNYIGISEPPLVQYSKILSIPDSLMLQYIDLCTELSLDVDVLSPMVLKKKLAFEIVRLYHNLHDAIEAEKKWESIHSFRKFPLDAEEIIIPFKDIKIVDLIELCNINLSKSEIKTLISQNGISINGNKISNLNAIVTVNFKDKLKIGKKNFFYISHV